MVNGGNPWQDLTYWGPSRDLDPLRAEISEGTVLYRGPLTTTSKVTDRFWDKNYGSFMELNLLGLDGSGRVFVYDNPKSKRMGSNVEESNPANPTLRSRITALLRLA